jgi:hypothetical protein
MYFHQQLLFDQGVRILHLLVVHKILVHEEQNVVQYLMEDQILNGSETVAKFIIQQYRTNASIIIKNTISFSNRYFTDIW